jgi:hypothetical protein
MPMEEDRGHVGHKILANVGIDEALIVGNA